jgi:hypothetical protein
MNDPTDLKGGELPLWVDVPLQMSSGSLYALKKRP